MNGIQEVTSSILVSSTTSFFSPEFAMNAQRLLEILNRLPQARIGVLGDFCLDRYFDIEPVLVEISRETGRSAPQVFRVRCSPGGAGNVAANVKDLGTGSVFAIGPLGEDGEGFALRKALSQVGVLEDYLISHPGYLTPTYNKPLLIKKDSEPEELDRIDIRTRGVMPRDLEEMLIDSIARVFPTLDGLLVADQFEERNHHCVTDRIREKVLSLAREYPRKVVFADSRARTSEFTGVYLKPNAAEAALSLGLETAPTDLPGTVELGRKLSAKCGQPVYITIGEQGILLCESPTAPGCHIPGFPVPPPVDICGAGDTTISAMAAALCAGADHQEAGLLGCLAASITVQKIGITGTANPEELILRRDEYEKLGLSLKTL